MSVVTARAADPADPSAAPARSPRAARPWRWHLGTATAALGLALWVTHGLWQDPAGHVIADNAGDQAFFEWLLGYGVYTLGHGSDPFFTDLLNSPLGVNLAANTSITVYTVVFSPLTALAGPPVSFSVILTLNLACAAFAWYLFLHRYVVTHPAAAAVAGMFAGFAPGFISHANGHLNWSAGWVAPVLLWWVLRLRQPGRWLRNGLVLGLLVAIGFSVAAEGLFFTALACAIFLGTWSLAAATRAEARAAAPTVLAALAVTAVVAGALLAYPLYMHFDGPQSFAGTGFNQRHYAEDLTAFYSYSSRSLAGVAGLGSGVAPNPTEETSFFGVPLILLTVGGLIVLRRHADAGRRATLRALSVTGVVFVVVSLGPRLRVLDIAYDVPLPYAVLARLPLFDSALPARFALVVAGVLAVVLALIADRVLTGPPRPRHVRAGWAAAFALALVPIVPVPLLYTDRAEEPAFIADGTWQKFVPDGGVLTALPIASDNAADAQRWQAYTMARRGPQFRIPAGYFLGPGGRDGTGRIGALPRRTAWLFDQAGRHARVPPIDVFDRQQARIDFVYWGIDVVVLPAVVNGARGELHRDALLRTATDLLGPPQRVSDVDVWRIRRGIDPTDSVAYQND